MNTVIVIIIFALIISLLCILYFRISKIEIDTMHMNKNIVTIDGRFDKLEQILIDHNNANIVALNRIKDAIETADANNVEEINDINSAIKSIEDVNKTIFDIMVKISVRLEFIDSKLNDTCKGECGTIHHCQKERATEPKKKASIKPKSNKTIKTEKDYISVTNDTK